MSDAELVPLSALDWIMGSMFIILPMLVIIAGIFWEALRGIRELFR